MGSCRGVRRVGRVGRVVKENREKWSGGVHKEEGRGKAPFRKLINNLGIKN